MSLYCMGEITTIYREYILSLYVSNYALNNAKSYIIRKDVYYTQETYNYLYYTSAHPLNTGYPSYQLQKSRVVISLYHMEFHEYIICE